MTEIQDNFNFFVPIQISDIEKASKQTGSKRYDNMMIEGLASDPTKDTDEETLMPNGYVIDRFLKYGFLNYDHRSKDDPKYFIGEPVEAKVNDNKFFVKAKLYKDNEVARNLYDTMLTLKKSGSTRKVGFSIEGKALERDIQNPKKITKALITGLAATLNPKNSNSYADIVKGEQSEDYIEYAYASNLLEKSEANGGKMTYLVDIMDEAKGIRYTIDEDLKLKVTKAISTETAGALVKEDLERKIKVLPFGKDVQVKKIIKAVEAGILDESVLEKIEIKAEAWNTLKKAFLAGDISKDILVKARSKQLQAKHPGSNWKTIKGAHVLVGGNGEIIAGAGGKIGAGKGAKSESGKKENVSVDSILKEASYLKDKLRGVKGNVELRSEERDTKGKRGQDKYEIGLYQGGKKVGSLGSHPSKGGAEAMANRLGKKSEGKKVSDLAPKVVEKIKKEGISSVKNSIEKFKKDAEVSKKTLAVLKKQGSDKQTKSGIEKYTQSIADKEYMAKELEAHLKSSGTEGKKSTGDKKETSETGGKKETFKVDSKYTGTDFKDNLTVQRLKDSIKEGMGYLKSGKTPSGKKMEEGQKEAIKRSIENSKKKIDTERSKGGKKAYHKKDSLNEFRDIAANAKDIDDFMSKLQKKKDVPAETSKEFFDKYNPSGTLTPSAAANKLLDEVKEAQSQKTPKLSSEEKSYVKNNREGVLKVLGIESLGDIDVSTDTDKTIREAVEKHKKLKK